jgi:hypothetical protein
MSMARRWCACVLLGACWAAGAAPAVVKVVEHDQRWQLLVDGAPFVIHGAGLGDGDLATLAARGGNAFRTWRTLPDPAAQRTQLDQAQALGLKVALGLEVGKQRHGFDYDDADAVARQRERIRADVLRYKDHPALLMWLVGNELNLASSNPKVWNAVGEIAAMIHQLDPNHPVSTPLAGLDATLVAQLQARAPQLDLLAVQLYGAIDTLPQTLRDSGWRGPYVVTEWGPTGHWEVPRTAWQAPIEDDSATKAALLLRRYRAVIAADTRQSLGAFVFLWGDKQERTPTWYGLFLPGGAATAGVDALQAGWTGAWPATRAPALATLTLQGRRAGDSVTLPPGSQATAAVRLVAGDARRWRWYVLEESTASSIGGDPEQLPAQVPLALTDHGDGRAELAMPARAGHYRLFVEAYDDAGRAGYANLPFRIAAPR